MHTLLVAPETNLVYSSAEVQVIWRLQSPAFLITACIGEVRHRDVLDIIDRHQYDVFAFVGHATNQGLMLTDGIVSSAELTPMIRGRFELTVLNSCDSLATAQMLQNETEAETIATIIDVPDRLAFQTSALFFRELAKSKDVPIAYHAARPGGNRTYVYLAGKKKWQIGQVATLTNG